MTDPTAKGYTQPCGAFRTDSSRARCVLESDHKEDHVWDDGTQAKGYTAPTIPGLDAMGVCDSSAAMMRDFPEITRSMIAKLARAYKKLLSELPVKAAPETDLERIQASYVTGSQTYTPETKAAPESEDEAFERAWLGFSRMLDPEDDCPYTAFSKGWNARARLDAERGR
jgi:hypothetical protein